MINKDLNHISHSLFLRPKKSDIDDFVSFMPLGCMTDTNFHTSLVGYTIGPLLVFALLLVSYRATKSTRPELSNRIFSYFLTLTFLILPSVSIKIFSTFACRTFDNDYGSFLKADYNIEIESRTIERVKRLSQNLAIVRAKQILYHTVGGKYVDVPFHPSQLSDAEELMVCTEEIVMHAIGLEFDSVISRNRRKVLEKVWLMHKENEMYKQDDKGDDNVNYMQIPGNVHSISKRLLNALMEDDVHVSSCNIQTVFEEIKDQTLNCFGYTNDSDSFGDGMPGYDSEKKRWSAYEEFGGNIYLHLDLFKDLRTSREEKNIYKLTLEKMVHRYSTEKLLVLGMNSFEFKEPRFWDTLHTEPNENNVIEMSHGIGDVEDVYDILGDTEDLDAILAEDLDVYVTAEHAKKIGRHIEPYEPMNQDWSHRIIAYPYRPKKRKR